MMEFLAATVLLAALWMTRATIRHWADVQASKAEVWSADQEIDMQKDIVALDKRVDETIKINGKWFAIDDVFSKMGR